MGTYVLPELLATFEKTFPGVEITLEILNSALIEDRVVANEFDLGFVGHPPASADLEGEQFLEDEIFFAVAPDHPLAHRTKVHPTQIVGERLILREPVPGRDGRWKNTSSNSGWPSPGCFNWERSKRSSRL